MADLNLTVSVHCIRPDWAISNQNEKFNDVRYRIYINEQLIVERNWIWSNNHYLNENVWIDNNSKEYEVRLEPVLIATNQAKFTLKDLKITNAKYYTNLVQDTRLRVELT
jgi:hypothetical protein